MQMMMTMMMTMMMMNFSTNYVCHMFLCEQLRTWRRCENLEVMSDKFNTASVCKLFSEIQAYKHIYVAYIGLYTNNIP
jgi:hypothetical protein